MGSLIQQQYTIPFPKGAKIKGDQVTWTSKEKAKTGILSGPDRVAVRSGVWYAQYTDESGKQKRVSTGCRDKAAANKMLVKLENEVTQIRTGVLSRRDIDSSYAKNEPIKKHLDDFYISQKAKGVGEQQIKDDESMLPRLFQEAGIETLAEITKSRLDLWIVGCLEGRIFDPKKKRIRGARTINSYMDRLRVFCRWCVDEKRLHSDPTAKIKDQNEDVDKRKDRRSLTTQEIDKLIEAAKVRKRQKNGKLTGDEVEMIYRTALGTGLRSTELASLCVYQIEPERYRISLRAAGTKNKKGVFQPLTPDLADRLASWIMGKSPTDPVFRHDKHSLMSSFKRDCQAAGIERLGADGRSVDVHSLRRTFGTMLARAGVPLTTTQRLMRHSTPELTAKLYIDVEPIDMMEAIAKLPTF